MVQLGSFVKVTDKSSIVLGQCVKILGSSQKHIAHLGDVILISIQWINSKRFIYLKPRLQRMFFKGAIHRALVIRSKVNFRRTPGVHIRFNQNAVVLVTKGVAPVSNIVYGPVLLEMCIRWPSFGCVSYCVI